MGRSKKAIVKDSLTAEIPVVAKKTTAQKPSVSKKETVRAKNAPTDPNLESPHTKNVCMIVNELNKAQIGTFRQNWESWGVWEEGLWIDDMDIVGVIPIKRLVHVVKNPDGRAFNVHESDQEIGFAQFCVIDCRDEKGFRELVTARRIIFTAQNYLYICSEDMQYISRAIRKYINFE